MLPHVKQSTEEVFAREINYKSDHFIDTLIIKCIKDQPD